MLGLLVDIDVDSAIHYIRRVSKNNFFEYCKTNRQSGHAFPSHLDLCQAVHISPYTPPVVVIRARPLLARPPMYRLTYYRRKRHRCSPVLHDRPAQLLGQTLQKNRLKAMASTVVVVCFARHQLANMVAGDLAVGKRGSAAGGEEVEAGSPARVFCCPTFLMGLGCRNA